MSDDTKIPPLHMHVGMHDPDVVQARKLDTGTMSVTLGREGDPHTTVHTILYLGDDANALKFVTGLVETIRGIAPDFRDQLLEKLTDQAIDEHEAETEGVEKLNTGAES